MLEQRVKNITNGIKSKNELNLVSEKNIRLKTIVKKISDFNSMFTTDKIAKNVLDVELEIKDISDIRRLSKSISNKIDNNNYSDTNEDITRLSEVIRKIDSSLRVEWRTRATNEAKSVISSLDNIKDLFDDKKEINNKIAILREFENRWPINLEIKDHFNAELSKSSDIILKLNLTENIESFIKKIINKTATFNDLTDEVLIWIKDNNFENKIKIGF